MTRLLLGGTILANVRDVETGEEDIRVCQNRVLEPYQQHIADLLDPTTGTTVTEASHFAVGSDGTSNANLSATFLGNEQFRTTIADTTRFPGGDKRLESLGVLSVIQANGVKIKEVGLVDDSKSTPINRAVVDPLIRKTENKEVEFVFLQSFNNESEL